MTAERPTPPSFEALPEDWQSALFVVAHPDDIEYGAAAAVARWTGQGKKVVYCMVTSGEAGIDGILEYGVELRRALAKVVREQRPDVALTINFRETFGGTSLNQADHIAVGKALLDAVRDAGNRWVFPAHLTDGLEPWGGVKAVWAGGSPQAAHAVDVTDTFAAGVASLKEHRAYIEGLGWEGWDPEEFLDGILRGGGQGLGVTHASTFEVFPLGWG